MIELTLKELKDNLMTNAKQLQQEIIGHTPTKLKLEKAQELKRYTNLIEAILVFLGEM
jgi:hypothetical protein